MQDETICAHEESDRQTIDIVEVLPTQQGRSGALNYTWRGIEGLNE